MAGAAIDDALARIASALDRVEAAASRRTTDEDLRYQHDRLREAVSQSLHQIDELLAGHRS